MVLTENIVKKQCNNNVFEGFFIYVFELAERFYGDKCVNHRVLKENIAKTCKHTSKDTGFGRFCGKIANNGAKCRLDSFLGAVVVAI